MDVLGRALRRWLGPRSRQAVAGSVASAAAELRRQGLGVNSLDQKKKESVSRRMDVEVRGGEGGEDEAYMRAMALVERGARAEAIGVLETVETPAARYQLGRLIDDEERALRLTVRAAKEGVVPALRDAANMFAAGRGCEAGPESDRKALLLYETAAAATADPEAHFQIGSWACKGRPDGTPDWDKGFVHHKIAADAGLPKARHNLATHYFSGKGVEQDFGLAFTNFEAAALAGMPQAMRNLANMLDQGLGTTKDPDRAAEWRALADDILPPSSPIKSPPTAPGRENPAAAAAAAAAEASFQHDDGIHLASPDDDHDHPHNDQRRST